MASEMGKLMGDLVEKVAPADALNGVKQDWYKFGVAFIVARLLTNQSLEGLANKDWAINTLLVLLGFTAYRLLTVRLVDTKNVSNMKMRNALDDVLKFGTMMVVSRLLAGKSLNDKAWMKTSAMVLAGFVVFDLGTVKATEYVSGSEKVKMAAFDAIKFGTMYGVSRYLEAGNFTREWAIESGAFIAGLVGFDLLLA